MEDERRGPTGFCHTLEVEALMGPYMSSTTGYAGGIEHFRFMPGKVLAEVLRAAPVLEAGAQNDAPTFAEFVVFGEKYPRMTFHGYVVSARRTDERISVEGFEGPADLCDGMTKEDYAIFARADEFDPHAVRAWWD